MSPAALAAVPGDPDTVLALATRLRGQAAKVGSLARLLRSLTTAGGSGWQGPAAAAFTRRAEAAVTPLLRIETRYAVAAATLVPLAEALRECQAAVAAAVAERNDAFPRFLALGDAMAVAEQSAEASGRAQAVRLREAMVVQGCRVELAEAAHAAARERWRAADLRAAQLLGRLVQDGLADDRLYDALTATSRTTGATAEVAGALELVPPLRAGAAPVALAATGGQLASDVALRLAYGDGDWGTIVLRGAAAAAGPVGTGLKASAAAGRALPGEATSAVRVGDRHTPGSAWRHAMVRASVNPPAAWPDRLRVGLAEGWADAVGVAKSGQVRNVVTGASIPSGARARADWLRHRGLDYARARATAYAANTWLDDWARATASGPTAQSVYVAGSGVSQAGKAAQEAAGARQHQAGQHGR